jgi:transposase InsO family protein
LEIEICAAYERTRGTCGSERPQKDLAEYGVKVGSSRVRRIRKKLGIRCKQAKKFKMTTNSKHTLPVAENLLERNFEVSLPNRVWVSLRRLKDDSPIRALSIILTVEAGIARDDVMKLLKRLHIKASMGRKGNCYDNAPMESFWGTLKKKPVYHQHYSSREQAIREIAGYIEIFYNRQRRQKRLGGLITCCL